HFSTGITKLKQVGGRAQRDMQRFIIIVIAGAADPDVVVMLHVLMEFRYYSQSTSLTLVTQDKIQSTLQEFHEHKGAIIKFGLHRGPTTNAVLKHWHIPKLELMQNIVPSIE
ncbi:hypothetical protein L210DRAFT_3328440, partial [Boletus edulis BED1]